MRIFRNLNEVNLMIWETDPNLRNKEPYNEVCFIAHKDKEFNKGDLILNNIHSDKISTYELTYLIEKKESAHKDHVHYKCKTIYKKQESAMLLMQYKNQ